MATLEQSLVLKDKFTSTLNRVGNSIDRTINQFERFNQSTTRVRELDASLRRLGMTASRSIQVPKVTVPKAPSTLPTAGTTGLNAGLATSQMMLSRLTSMSRLLNFQIAIQALRVIGSMIGGLVSKADTFIQIMARLNTVADGTKAGQELQDSLMAAANRSRSGFSEMADSVAKLRSQAGEAFKNNDEAIAFAEQLNKLYKLGGASLEQQKAGTLQITQALASGVLRGDEFNSMMENAPLVAQKLAQHLGVGVGQLREMAKDGQLTGDALKNALLGSAVATNEEFARLPMTFGDMITQIKNVGMYAFQPLIQSWQQFISSVEGQTFMQALQMSMFAIADVALWLFNLFRDGFSWMINNMDVVMSVLSALAIAIAIMGAVWVANHIAMIVASWELLLPYLIIIGVIIGLIVLVQMFGVSTLDVIAGIVAGFVFLGTIIYDVIAFAINLFAMLFQFIVSIIAMLHNHFVIFAEFFLNMWRHPIYSAKRLFVNLVKNVINGLANIVDSTGAVGNAIGQAFIAGANMAIRAINAVISALNKIPGFSLSTMSEIGGGGGVSVGNSIRSFADSFSAGDEPDDYQTLEKMNPQPVGEILGYANPLSLASSAFDGTKSLGASAMDKFKDFTNTMGHYDDLARQFDQQNALAPGSGAGNGGVGDKLGKGKNIGNVGKVEDEIKLKDEDIKMMRDIAERQYVVDYQVLTPQVSVHYESNNSATEQDINDLVGKVEEKIFNLVNSDLGYA
nr:MAG TPA: Tail tape measure [Bacteriophage sp.]